MRTKRLLLFLLLALACVLPARAQKLALGAGAGTDGISVELAAALGGHVQLRTGYGFSTGLLGVNVPNISVPEHPGNPSGATVAVPMTVKLGINEGRLLFDFFPGSGDFHLTVGAHLGSPTLVRGTLKGLPSDYNTAGLYVDGYLVKATGGVLEASLCGKGLGSGSFAVKPYAGVGYGRALKKNSRIFFSVDLGAQYQGKPFFQAQGETVTGRKKTVPLSDDVLENLIPGYSGYAEQYLGWLVVWPTLSAHLYVKLF